MNTPGISAEPWPAANGDAANGDATDGAVAPAVVLVAGVGNIFLSDDGFGPEVARRMTAQEGSGRPGARAVDYGIRGMHLAYDLLDGVDALILVDAVPPLARNDGSEPEGNIHHPSKPGTIRVLQIRPEDVRSDGGNIGNGLGHNTGSAPGSDRGNIGSGPPPLDPHGMDPVAVFGRLRSLGGTLPLTFVVGCVPGDLREGIGLSAAVSAAVPDALAAIRSLIAERIPLERRTDHVSGNSRPGD